MKKFTIVIILLAAATLANAQILYSISGNGLKKTSYIVGTHHLCDESFAHKIPGLDKAMKTTKQVYGEVVMSDLTNPDSILIMQQAMMLPDGKTIKDVLDSEHFQMLNDLFTDLIGISFDNPMIFGSMGTMRPAAIESQIAVLMYLKEHPAAFDPTKGIDSYLQNQAIQNKKAVGGLETCKFQIELMYNSKSPEEEAKSLACILENPEVAKNQLNALTEAYTNQNADGIVEAMDMKFGNYCDEINVGNTEQLLSMRNHNWLALMPAIMKSNPTLFVVGAGHLLGDDGIVTLLRTAGYKVEPVEK